jgi:hypothetical protein
VVSDAGSLLAQVAGTVGLTNALSLQLAGLKQRRRGHDPGRVIRDQLVMLSDGGECISAIAEDHVPATAALDRGQGRCEDQDVDVVGHY